MHCCGSRVSWHNASVCSTSNTYSTNISRGSSNLNPPSHPFPHFTVLSSHQNISLINLFLFYFLFCPLLPLPSVSVFFFFKIYGLFLSFVYGDQPDCRQEKREKEIYTLDIFTIFMTETVSHHLMAIISYLYSLSIFT